VGRLPRLGTPWDRAVIVPIEAVWWIHSLPVRHLVDDARLHPAGPDGTPDWSAIPLGPPWVESELTGVPAIVVQPGSPAAGYQLRQRFRGGGEVMAVVPAEVLLKLYRALGEVRELIGAISFLTQLLVLAAILLAVLAGLERRRRQIAVLRALGAPRAYVFATLWTGVSTLLVAGAMLGLGLGYLGALALSRLFGARTALELPVSIAGTELALLGWIVLVGLLLATVPAILGYRGSVAADLRA
jgi:putative ABC transport system permease protein